MKGGKSSVGALVGGAIFIEGCPLKWLHALVSFVTLRWFNLTPGRKPNPILELILFTTSTAAAATWCVSSVQVQQASGWNQKIRHQPSVG